MRGVGAPFSLWPVQESDGANKHPHLLLLAAVRQQ